MALDFPRGKVLSLFLLLFFCVFKPAYAINHIEKINYLESLGVKKDVNFFSITCQKKIKSIKTFYLKKPNRYVVDIRDARLLKKLEGKFSVNSKKIKSIRASNHKRFARIVFDFRGKTAPVLQANTRGNILRIEEPPDVKNYVQEIEIKEGRQELVWIICKENIYKYAFYHVRDHNRVIIEIENARLAGKLKRRYFPRNPKIISIQAVQRKNKARLIFTLKGVMASSLIVKKQDNILTLGSRVRAAAWRPSAKLVPELKIKGQLVTKYSQDLEVDNDFENAGDMRSFFAGEMKFAWSSQKFFKAGIRVRHIEEWDASPYSSLQISPAEIYLNLAEPGFYITAGNQIVRWGRTDEISPIDVINPEDLTELFNRQRAERKLAAPILRLGWLNEILNIEMVYLPIVKESEVIYFGSDWAIFDQVKKRISHVLPRAQEIEFNNNKPDFHLANSELGIRFTKNLSNFDLGLSFFYGWEDSPLIAARTPVGQAILAILFDPDLAAEIVEDFPVGFPKSYDLQFDLQYQRFCLYGLDFETTLWDMGIRGEVVYFKDRGFLRADDLGLINKDLFHAVIGLDYFVTATLYLNMLYSYARVIDYEEVAGTPQTQQDIAGSLAWHLIEDVYTINLNVVYSPSNGSVIIQPHFLWNMGDILKLKIGLNIMWADQETAFFNFKHNNNLYFEGAFYF